MANIDININELLPQAGSNSGGIKLAYTLGAVKATQGDTVTLIGASVIISTNLTNDVSGVPEIVTLTGTNVMTMTNVGVGSYSGTILYR